MLILTPLPYYRKNVKEFSYKFAKLVRANDDSPNSQEQLAKMAYRIIIGIPLLMILVPFLISLVIALVFY